MEKRHLGVNAEKYSYTKEMSPLNEGIQAEHLEHTQMNKPWYVESCVCLPEGCTQLRAWQTFGKTGKQGEAQRGKQRSSQQGRGSALLVSSQAKKYPRSAKRCKRSIRAPAFKLLLTTHFILTSSFLNRNKFAVQSPGRKRDFHLP